MLYSVTHFYMISIASHELGPLFFFRFGPLRLSHIKSSSRDYSAQGGEPTFRESIRSKPSASS